MEKATHALTTNGYASSVLTGMFLPVDEEVSRALHGLDGESSYAYALWRIPTDQTWLELDIDKYPVWFLQCAGNADRLTIEVKYVEDDGVARQYTVGRPGGTYSGDPTEIIEWAGHRASVFDNEVFTADEALPIFLAYGENDRVPDEFLLRPLTLD